MNKIIKLLSLSLILGLVTSCEDNEDFTGASNVNFSPVPVQLLTTNSSYTFNESMIDSNDPSTNTIEVMATIAEPQSVDLFIDIYRKSGSANNDDFSVARIAIPALSTSGKTKIEILKTGDIEGDENLVLSAKGANTLVSFNLPISIQNDYINNVLDISATWEGSHTYTPAGLPAEITIDYCEMDFDVLLYTESDAFIGYVAGTAACVESGNLSDLADGKYKLAVDLYENPFSGLGVGQAVPITITYSQEGFIASTDIKNTYFTTDSNPELIFVAEVEVKDGYMYTVTPL